MVCMEFFYAALKTGILNFCTAIRKYKNIIMYPMQDMKRWQNVRKIIDSKMQKKGSECQV